MFSLYNNIDNWPLFAILLVWSLIWKGLALWRSAQLGQKPWFVAMLIINTAGILEIIYLLITQKRVKRESGIKNQGSGNQTQTKVESRK